MHETLVSFRHGHLELLKPKRQNFCIFAKVLSTIQYSYFSHIYCIFHNNMYTQSRKGFSTPDLKKVLRFSACHPPQIFWNMCSTKFHHLIGGFCLCCFWPKILLGWTPVTWWTVPSHKFQPTISTPFCWVFFYKTISHKLVWGEPSVSWSPSKNLLFYKLAGIGSLPALHLANCEINVGKPNFF